MKKSVPRVCAMDQLERRALLAGTPLNMTEVAQFGGSIGAPTIQGNLAYFCDGPFMKIANISDPAHPQIVGRVALPEDGSDIALRGNLAYIGDGSSGVQIVDISNITAPAIVGGYDFGNDSSSWVSNVAVSGNVVLASLTTGHLQAFTSGGVSLERASLTSFGFQYIHEVVMAGSLAFIAYGDNLPSVRVMDFSNPSAPVTVSNYSLSGNDIRGMWLDGSRLYVAKSNEGVDILNVANPANISTTGHFNTAGFANAITVAGSIAYVSDDRNGLQLFDVSNASAALFLGQYASGNRTYGAATFGSSVLVADDNGLLILDVSNPSAPQSIGGYQTAGDALAVTVDGSIAYVAAAEGGVHILDMTNPSAPAQIGEIDSLRYASDIAIADHRAYVADAQGGLKVFDVSNPASPLFLGGIDTPGIAVAVTVSDGIAYVADTNSVQVFRVGMQNVPSWIAEYAGNALDVLVRDSVLFVAARSGGVRFLDISIPQTPQLVGSWTGSGANAIHLNGSTLCVVGDGGLALVNISNLATPTLLSWSSAPGVAGAVAMVGSYIFVTSDRSLMVFDASNPASPQLVNTVYRAGAWASGVAVSGSHAYFADGQAGLSVFSLGVDFVPPVPSVNFDFQTRKLLQLVFPEDVSASITQSDIVITRLSATGAPVEVIPVTSYAYLQASNVVEVEFATGTADGNFSVTLVPGGVSDSAGNPVPTDWRYRFFTLAGDANHDRKVDIADLAALAANWQGAAKTFSQGDFDYNGVVDASDLAILAMSWQKTLAPPAPAAPVSTRPAPPKRTATRVASLVL